MRFGKHVILFALAAGASLFLLLRAYDEVRRGAVERLVAQETSLARQAAEGIETLFATYRSMLEALAQDPHVIALDEDGRQRLRPFARANRPNVLSLSRMDARGRMVFITPQESASGLDISGQPHVAWMLRTHQPVVSEVIDSVQGPRGVGLHIPVFDGDRFDGSVSLLFPFDRIARQYVGNIRVGRTGYAMILSRGGVELYCPVAGHVGRLLTDNIHENAGERELARWMAAGDSGNGTYRHGQEAGSQAPGMLRRAVFRPVRLLNTWWSIAVTAPEEEAMDFIAGFRDRWLMLAGALGLAALLAAFQLYRMWVNHREQDRRAAMEKALREREVLLESMLMNLPVDFWARDLDMKCIMQSHISIQFWGDLRQAAFPSKDQDPETLRKWAGNNRRALAGETLSEEVELTLPDGGRRSFHNIVAPIRDQGAIIGILGVNIDLTQRKLSEERIRASLKEKELLLKEIHHRVKNNLQIVASLLNLQAGQVRDPEVLALFMETRGRITSMSLVHEELYRSGDLAHIDFLHYARNLGEKLRFVLAQDRGVALEVDGDEAELPIDAAVPCGLILNELLTNALKHAFPDGRNGTVRAGIAVQGGEMVLSVEDDGVGFPEELDPARAESLGMQIVIGLCEQLRGRLDIRRAPGTRVSVTFPLP